MPCGRYGLDRLKSMARVPWRKQGVRQGDARKRHGNRSEEEKLNQSLVLDGIIGIADGQNPRVIEGILKNYLAASKRGTSDEED